MFIQANSSQARHRALPQNFTRHRTQAAALPQAPTFHHTKPIDVANFLDQLGLMLANGLAPAAALEGLAAGHTGTALGKVLNDINERVFTGMRLSRAFAAHPRVFPASALLLVQAGEQGGDIAGQLQRAARLMRRSHNLGQRVRGAVMSPLITAVICAVVLFFVINSVFPRFIGMYEQLNLNLPWLSRLIFLGVGICSHPLTWLALASLLGLAFHHRAELREKGFDLLLRVPTTRVLVGRILAASTCETMAFLYSQGIPFHRVLGTLADSAPFRTHRECLKRCQLTLQNEGSLVNAMAHLTYFPPIFHSMVKIGEESGSFTTLLESAQEMLEQEVDLAIDQISAIAEPVVTTLTGVSLAILFSGMFMPVYHVLEKLGSAI